MAAIHFVYAGDPNGELHYSPYTITQHLYKYLRPKFADVHYYDWCHTGPLAPVAKNDFILGHPNYASNTPTRRLFQAECRAKLLIFPFHHGLPEINWPFDDLVRQCDKLLSITGPYWYDTIGNTRFAHWLDKMVRLDMAIDTVEYPVSKAWFNAPGNRSFYHVGCDRAEKNTQFLYELFSRVPYQLLIYGVFSRSPLLELPNVRYYGWQETSFEFAARLSKVADFFINTSISDANPTTILEAASWGYPVVCSPTSGYWPDKDYGFFGLNLQDVDGCVNLLHHLQYADEAELRQRASQAHDMLSRHSWDLFCDKVWQTICTVGGRDERTPIV